MARNKSEKRVITPALRAYVEQCELWLKDTSRHHAFGGLWECLSTNDVDNINYNCGHVDSQTHDRASWRRKIIDYVRRNYAPQ